jgi:ferredoxin-nitrate reductase
MRESFGSDGQPGSYRDIDVTDCVFLVGHNMASTQTVLWSRILDRLEGPNPPKIIVIDPRKSSTAKRATIHLAPKIGTNMAVLNGIQHLMIKNDWINHGYVTKHTIFYDDLKTKVETYTPDVVARISGVPEKQLIAAAEIIGKTPTLLSTCLQGVYQSNQATASACQVNNINLLRGLIGKPGSGIFQMNGQPTAQNNRETGCDGEFPAFRNPLNPNHMQELADIWNIDYEKVPHWNQPTHIENMLKYIESGTIQMFWISATNPLVSLPDLAQVRKQLTKPDLFVVVQDIFLTETAAIADVVLPAAMWGEKTGCFTNVDRTVHVSHKAIDPPGEARSDLDIFLDFSRRMDFRDKNGDVLIPFSTPEDVFEAWKKMSAGRPCDYTGLSYYKLTGGSGLQWPCTEDAPFGTERLYQDGRFFTDIEECESFGHDLETGHPYTKAQYMSFRPAGKAILKASHYIPPLETPDDKYPLQLSTGRDVFHFHTRTKTGRVAELQKASPEPRLTLNKKDAEKFDIHNDDLVLIESVRGQIEIQATIGEIAEGQVFIPFHYGYWDATDGRARAANELTQSKHRCSINPYLKLIVR